jgi:hypothetical protein
MLQASKINSGITSGPLHFDRLAQPLVFQPAMLQTLDLCLRIVRFVLKKTRLVLQIRFSCCFTEAPGFIICKPQVFADYM